MKTRSLAIVGIGIIVATALAGCVSRRDAAEQIARQYSAPISESIQVQSPLGKTWVAPAVDPTDLRVANLNEAIEELQANPDDPDAWIWVGRRLGYLWRMNEAVDVYSRALRLVPDHPALLRHRGHRYISLRRFDDAIADLERAADLVKDKPDEIEPDGMPNARDIPLTTLKFNIWYHLALAHLLSGDPQAALPAWQQAARFGRQYDDNIVAVTHWQYVTLRHLGRDEQADQLLAAIQPDMDIIENAAYHRLCLMYKGMLSPDEVLSPESDHSINAAAAFGVGAWRLRNGDRQGAKAIFNRIIQGGEWPAFGFIAAEVWLTHAWGVMP